MLGKSSRSALKSKAQGVAKSKGRFKHAFLRRATKHDYLHDGSFHEAIQPVVLLAQIFALMPIRGIGLGSVEKLSFSWHHARAIYSFLVLICFGIYSGFVVSYAYRQKFDFDAMETITFNVSTFLISAAFYNLARKWPQLMMQWAIVERQLPSLFCEKDKSNLVQHIKMITLIVTICSLVEHLLSMLKIIYYVNACPTFANNPMDSFLYATSAQFFYFIEYSTTLGVLGKAINVLSTFTWNFIDIFIMAVSVGLASRFRQLNRRMQAALKHPTTPNFWMQTRSNYRSLCRLCEQVDDNISWITLLCFSNNLFFICGKILKSIQKKPSMTHTIYFWFSLVYLVSRTLTLSLYTARINDESKWPLKVFRSVTRESWCPELKRFSMEVTSDIVALSGLKFFRLTRSAVLAVAGTIVTYELVLLQYNKEDKIHDCFES